MIEVTIVKGKIYYRAVPGSGITLSPGDNWPVLGPPPLASGKVRQTVTMTAQQFVALKGAGRRHASSATVKSVTDTMGLTFSRNRADRTKLGLEKYDVGHYRELTGQAAPAKWGPGNQTNRDHVLSNASNQRGYRPHRSNWPYFTKKAEIKGHGPAITVEGIHHRQGSITYGGRNLRKVGTTGLTRRDYGAFHPTESAKDEIGAMLAYKASKRSKKPPGLGVQLRVTMVGAYNYLYQTLADRPLKSGRQTGTIKTNDDMDETLLYYLQIAVISGKI